MSRTILICLVLAATLAATAAGARAQEEGQNNPYSGTSNPPADDVIVTTTTVEQAAQPAQPTQPTTRTIIRRQVPPPTAVYQAQPNYGAQPAYAAQPSYVQQPAYADPVYSYPPQPGNDEGVVEVVTDPYQPSPAQPKLTTRTQQQQRIPYYLQGQSAPTAPQTTASPYSQQDPNYLYAQQQPANPAYRQSQTTPYTQPQADPYYQQGRQQGQAYPYGQTGQTGQYGQYGPTSQYGQSDPYYSNGQPNSSYRPTRPTAYEDPDGDIVHPYAGPSGQVAPGVTLRTRLIGRVSTADAIDGERFRTHVVADVVQSGRVLIPVGSEIDGRIYQVSSGHVGGKGSMHLQPDTVILPNGSRYRLYAQVTGAPGARARVGVEGDIVAGSRLKRDTIEYGSGIGTGAATGAYLGGPVGALTGGLIGAGVITVHLLLSHPQATLENGTPLVFTLTQRLSLVPTSPYHGD